MTIHSIFEGAPVTSENAKTALETLTRLINSGAVAGVAISLVNRDGSTDTIVSLDGPCNLSAFIGCIESTKFSILMQQMMEMDVNDEEDGEG